MSVNSLRRRSSSSTPVVSRSGNNESSTYLSFHNESDEEEVVSEPGWCWNCRSKNDDDFILLGDDEEEETEKKCCCQCLCCKNLSRRRCYWLSCFLFLFFNIVFTVIGIYVIGPIVAEHIMNNTPVEVDSLSVLSYTNDSIRIRMEGGLDLSSPFDVTMKPCDVAVSVDTSMIQKLLNAPHAGVVQVGTFHVPTVQVEGGKKIRLNISAEFDVVNLDVFASMNAYMVDIPVAQSIPWKAEGSLSVAVHVKAWFIKFDIQYDDLSYHNHVPMAGMGGMKNVTVGAFTLPGNAPDGAPGVQIHVNATVWNPSYVSTPLPESEVEIYWRGLRVGRMIIPAFHMHPGINAMHLHGVIDPSQEDATALSPFFSDYVQHVNTWVTVVPDVLPDEPLWLSALMSKVTLDMPVVSNMNIAFEGSIDIHSVDVYFDSNGLPVISSNVDTTFRNPFDIPIQVLGIWMNVSLLDIATQSEVVGSLNLQNVNVQSKMGDPELHVQFHEGEFQVVKQEGFNQLVVGMLDRPMMTVLVDVVVDVKINSNMGVLKIDGIPLKNISVSVAGMNDFRTEHVGMGAIQSASGLSPNELQVETYVTIGNPTNISAEIGTLMVDMTYDSPKYGLLKLGTAYLPDAAINRSTTMLLARSTIEKTPQNEPAIAEFMSRFVTQDRNIMVGMIGRADSTPIKILQPVISKMRLEMPFAVPAYNFIISVHVKVCVWRMLLGHGIVAHVVAFNPLPVPVVVTGLNINVKDTKGYTIYVMVTKASEPLIVQPGSSHVLNVDVPVSGIKIGVFHDALKTWSTKNITVNLDGSLTFKVGEFEQTFEYVHNNVKAHVVVDVFKCDD